VSLLLFAGCVVGVTDGFGFVMGETKPTDRWRSEELAFVVLFRPGWLHAASAENAPTPATETATSPRVTTETRRRPRSRTRARDAEERGEVGAIDVESRRGA
jgi:hypothetical protein